MEFWHNCHRINKFVYKVKTFKNKNIMEKDKKNQLLGKESYSTVVKEIVEKIQKCQADTLVGNEFLKNMYSKLNESTNITPLLSLKPFITGAEKIAGDDVSLKEIIDFLKKKITGNADLNFLINLVKEEHFENLSRMGHPDPTSTIKNIEEEFNKPSSVIEEGIKSGLFDNLKSELLNKIKTDIDTTPDKGYSTKNATKDLKESDALFNGNLVKYSPIGIKYEDIANNRIVMLTESAVLEYNHKSKTFKVPQEQVIVPENYGKLSTAINSCAYNPETHSFSLNENWDFDLQLNPNGNITVNGKDIPKEKVNSLLLESVKAYTTDPLKVKNFNKMNYLLDADNFIALMENSDKLIKLDKLQVVKNLNENSFILIDRNNENPDILLASNGDSNKLFESYSEMVKYSNNLLGNNIVNLFESQLLQESILLNEKNTKIVSLMEEQKDINTNLVKVSNLKNIAEKDSPAWDKLFEQENQLNKKLDENIKNLNHYQNEFKLRK
jgi:hypothetical protein